MCVKGREVRKQGAPPWSFIRSFVGNPCRSKDSTDEVREPDPNLAFPGETEQGQLFGSPQIVPFQYYPQTVVFSGLRRDDVLSSYGSGVIVQVKAAEGVDKIGLQCTHLRGNGIGDFLGFHFFRFRLRFHLLGHRGAV